MRSPARTLQQIAIAAALGIGVAGHAQAMPLDLSGLTYVTYGDANSYALQVSGVIAGSTGPGSPYYVDSTAGQIKDLIVVATGASGGPVNTNLPGMDNALSTPSGVSGSNFFSGIWNSTLTAFTGFLAGNNPLFFFNNNQVSSGDATNQNVAVWAQVSLTGTGQTTRFFDFTNHNSRYALFTEGGGGVFMGDVTAYSSSGAGPIAGTNAATDYVLSGGPICLTVTNVPVSCSNPLAAKGPINNNLGANQAAYAINAPELNAFLDAWELGQLPGYTDIHINLRYGCDPLSGSAGAGNCIARDANNGYEQMFVGTSIPARVPKPGMLWLAGMAAIGLYFAKRRKN